MLIGVRVRRSTYCTSCAPDGPTSPVLATDEGVDELSCCQCGNALAIGPFCLGCGEAIPPDIESVFCSYECALERSHEACYC